MTKKKKEKGFAIASMVLSFGCLIPLLGFVCGMLSAIYGIIALVRIKRDPKMYGGLGMAIAGLVITLMFTAAWVYALVYEPERILGL